ncbi:probable low affinity copper uptake 2 [Pelobates cultripes]|uniref:Copper transport protein n=1 Tax=Pelobates cultripes TaxID=61616 RepID=A0AAD1WPV3_PELCU|nr:probable low affinity copper uptake 2 [Pelobates cultripes]
MQMYFIFSNNVTLLFDFWTVHTLAGLVLSFLVVLLLTILYEASKVWKSNLLNRVLLTIPVSPERSQSPTRSTDLEAESAATSDPLLSPDNLSNQNTETIEPLSRGYRSSPCRWWLLHGFVTLLHTAQVVLGYMIMLCVMSYNAAIFLSVIIGSALGYYVAFPLLSKYPKPCYL